MEVEHNEPTKDIDNLSDDQVLTEPVTNFEPTTVINELSIYGCDKLSVTIYHDAVLLHSDKPFTLRRFRGRLQINYRPSYCIELNPGCSSECMPLLTRHDVMGDRKPLKQYHNKHADIDFVRQMDDEMLQGTYQTSQLAKDAALNYLHWELQCDQRARSKRWDDDVELFPEHVRLQRLFELGYDELSKRRACDIEALMMRPTPARDKWVLVGAALDLKFFNRHGCRELSLENRTFHFRPTWGATMPSSSLIPYGKPVVIPCHQCDGKCNVHCPSLKNQ
jgi:hypothetical protein